jgi:hypothetical protein
MRHFGHPASRATSRQRGSHSTGLRCVFAKYTLIVKLSKPSEPD